MGTSRARLFASASAALVVLSACNAILGIGDLSAPDLPDGGGATDAATSDAPPSNEDAGDSGPKPGCTFTPHVPTPADGGTLDYPGWAMPDSPGTFNSPQYDTTVSGVVTDKLTKLIWQKGVAPTPLTHANAVAYCASLKIGALTSGWRLPKRIELLSLLFWGSPQPEAGIPRPSLSPEFDYPASTTGFFWSSTPYAAEPTYRWTVLFAGLVVGPIPAEPVSVTTFETRCVHDAPSGAAAAPKLSVSTDCGIVRDENTGLEWQRDFAPVAYANGAPANYCTSLALGAPGDKGGWRVPTMQELYTIVDTSRTTPAIDPALFPGSQVGLASSTLVGTPGDDPIAAALNLDTGEQSAISPGAVVPLRCMRPVKK